MRPNFSTLELKNNNYNFLASESYEFTSSGILCTNHINCRDQLCVNLDTGELIVNLVANATKSGPGFWSLLKYDCVMLRKIYKPCSITITMSDEESPVASREARIRMAQEAIKKFKKLN